MAARRAGGGMGRIVCGVCHSLLGAACGKSQLELLLGMAAGQAGRAGAG